MELIMKPPIISAAPVTLVTTASPIDIDLRRARLDSEHGKHQAVIRASLDTLHRALGERGVRRRGWTEWPTDDGVAESTVRERLADPNVYLMGSMYADGIRDIVRRLDAARVALVSNKAECKALDAEYERRPWRRFIQVTDGHIHSGMWCAGGSIRATTERNWFPWLSGWAVADAVAALGPDLCTHCFPDAPTAWTVGTKPARCEGSGKSPKEGTITRHGRHRYGACTGPCGTRQILTQYGFIRAHKPDAK